MPSPRRVCATLRARASSRAAAPTASRPSIAFAAMLALPASAPRASSFADRTVTGSATAAVMTTEITATSPVITHGAGGERVEDRPRLHGPSASAV